MTLRLLLSTLRRLLFPSWAFFDEAVTPPALEVRRVASSGDEGGWTAAVRAPTRRWWHLVINPEGTRTLAAQTAVERLYLAMVNDEPDSDELRTTRVLVANLAESAALDQPRLAADAGWQWRVVVQTGIGAQIITMSEVMP